MFTDILICPWFIILLLWYLANNLVYVFCVCLVHYDTSASPFCHFLCVLNGFLIQFHFWSFQVSKEHYERVKNSMKHNSNSIQSRSLNNVLGNIKTLHVKPFEAYEEEERQKLHEHWLACSLKCKYFLKLFLFCSGVLVFISFPLPFIFQVAIGKKRSSCPLCSLVEETVMWMAIERVFRSWFERKTEIPTWGLLLLSLPFPLFS